MKLAKGMTIGVALLLAGGCVMTGADFRETIGEAKSAVFPSLVYVRVIAEGTNDGKVSKAQASGSGVIISADGEFLTNNHVIDRATRIRCQLTGGASYPARLIGKDKDLDVALLKLEAPAGTVFPAARLSTRRLDVGEIVLAMGAPWGLARSVSMGIVSCNDRYLDDAGDYTLWYQTDAAISPGNSGGPLVDTHGEVVGLNTRGNTSGAQGFTIPSPIILEILPNLRRHGNAHWAWHGIDWQPLEDFERDAHFNAHEGVIVAGTDPQGPARAAGLLPTDRVIAIDGVPVTARFREDIPDLNRRLARKEIGCETEFEYVRGRARAKVRVKAVGKGDVEGKELEFRRWGFTAKDVNRFSTPDLAFFAPDGGVYVSSVSWEGNAERAGIRERDIIVRWGEREIRAVGDLKIAYDAAMKNLVQTTQMGVDVLRKGRRVHVIVNYRFDPDKNGD